MTHAPHDQLDDEPELPEDGADEVVMDDAGELDGIDAVEAGEGGEVARLNGYLHAIAAFEPNPDSEWLQVTFRFVDRDPQKMDYLSRLIARGTVQKHFVPGA